MFHQLFEGLSLGIRIAALPPPKMMHNDDSRTDCDGGVSTSRSSNQRTLNIKNYLWLSTFSSSSSLHHPHHRAQNRWMSVWKSWRDIHWLKPILSFLFAVTTPAGMISGILAFGPGQRKDAGKFTLLVMQLTH